MEASNTVKQARDPALQLNDLRDALAIVNVIHEIAETMQGDRRSEPLERLSRMAGDKIFEVIDGIDVEVRHG